MSSEDVNIYFLALYRQCLPTTALVYDCFSFRAV